jgi:ribosomal protein S18 acetylase RimI-like enzyme
VDVRDGGAVNLAGFVAATAGRFGVVSELRGGVAVAGPIALPHAYVNTAVPTNGKVVAADFVDDALAFFAGLGRGFVLWAPQDDDAFVSAVADRGLARYGTPTPAMVLSSPTRVEGSLRFERVTDRESAAVFGDVCERGYEQPGMAALMARHGSYDAPDTYWHLGFDGDAAVSAACGYLSGDVGGIYSVATPPEWRGRGFAAAVTAAAANHLFDHGVGSVVLQSNQLGFGVYQYYERFLVPG